MPDYRQLTLFDLDDTIPSDPNRVPVSEVIDAWCPTTTSHLWIQSDLLRYVLLYTHALAHLAGHTDSSRPKRDLEVVLKTLQEMSGMVVPDLSTSLSSTLSRSAPSVDDSGSESSVSTTPTHYDHKYSPYDVLGHWCPGTSSSLYAFLYGNTLKYLCRHPYKGHPQDDLHKATTSVESMLGMVSDELFV